MNLRDLEYLVALDKYRHFGRAAYHSFVSQPTLSTQIKKLEEELGVQLLERSNRQVIFTEVGQQILDEVKKLTQQVDNIRTISQSYKDPFQGKIRLGIIPTVAPYLLPHILPDLKLKWPKLTWILHELQTNQIKDSLQNGEIDAGILALPLGDVSIESYSLYIEPFLLAMHHSNPLSGQKKMGIQHLEGENFFLLQEGHCLRDQALEVCGRAGIGKADPFAATSLETICQMVEMGLGVTLLPELATHRYQQSNPNTNIRLARFFKTQPSREIGWVFRKSSFRKESYRDISNFIGDLINKRLTNQAHLDIIPI